MKGSDLKVFRKVNNLTQEQLGDYLGIKKSFISQIESGKCAMPTDKFNKLINNPYGWVTEMITNDGDSSQIDMLDWMEFLSAKRGGRLSSDTISSAFEKFMNPVDKILVDYLERKIEDKDRLIQNLYQQIGMLEAKNQMLEEQLEQARKGETASIVTGFSAADAV